MSEHFAPHAAFVAALPEDDPERRAAVRHAGRCERCRAALDEGTRLMELLEVARDGAEVPVGTMKALASAIEAEDRAAARRRALWPAAACALVFVVLVAVARQRDLRPKTLLVAAGVALLSILAAGSLQGRRAAAFATAVSLVFAVVMGSASLLSMSLGLKCTLTEVGAALLPWGLLRMTTPGGVPRWEASAAAAAGALSGHAALHVSCPVAHGDTHLLVFHFGGVVLAALLGALVPPRTVRPHA